MPAALIEADVQRSWARMTGAPVLVLLCLSMQDMDDYPDAGRGQAEYMMAVQGTAMAGQNLLLAAHALGPVGPAGCARRCSVLKLSRASWRCRRTGSRRVWSLSAGRPQTRNRGRRPLAELVQWR